MIQKQFAQQIVKAIKSDASVIGLAAGGSWLTNELDEYSDLDLILVTKELVSNDKSKMLAYAKRFGSLLNAFTGEHVGEPRVLICLYDNPLLHVDIKFLTLPEVHSLIELPAVLHDTDEQLKKAMDASGAKFPYPDYQWIEDRFWIWIHYGTVKIGRGEYFEVLDFFGALRSMVFGPLLLIRHNQLPRGVRKLETQLTPQFFKQLLSTVPLYDRSSMTTAIEASVALYKQLRKELFPPEVKLHTTTEAKVMEYFQQIKVRR